MSAAQVAAGLSWALRGGLTPDELAQRAWLAGDYATETAILRAAEDAREEVEGERNEEHAKEVDGLQAQIDQLQEDLEAMAGQHPAAIIAAAARARADSEHAQEQRDTRELLRQVAICLQTASMRKADARKALARLIHSALATPASVVTLRARIVEGTTP